MELWYRVITFSLLIFTAETSADPEPSMTNPQRSSITFTSLEYDGRTEGQPASSIHTNDMRITRVLPSTVIKKDTQLDNKIKNIFGNIFEHRSESGETTTCYFGELFQKNEQYYELKINPRSSAQIAIGYGYASEKGKLKGRTAEFEVNSKTKVLLSKNDKGGRIEVEIQSGSDKVVLASKNKVSQYRPVVCLNAEASINVSLFNGMKMARIPDADRPVSLPNSRKRLKALMKIPVKMNDTKLVKLKPSQGPLAFGLIEIHTLTSTTPHTYIFTGYFFDGRKWWMSPSLVDEESNWGEGRRYKRYSQLELTDSVINLTVWQRGRNGHNMSVPKTDRNWERRIYALYDKGEDVVAFRALRARSWLSNKIKQNCSGALTCPGRIECHWPRSERQNLRPGVCLEKICKVSIEAQLQTGLYKPEGDRTIGGETAMRLIAPWDVGVSKKGIPMIKALLDRAEKFGDIRPTGKYSFGGPISPSSGSGPPRRYIDGGNRYIDGNVSPCEIEKYLFILNEAGTKVGFAKQIEFYDYIRCTSYYGQVTNLVTNALHLNTPTAAEIYNRNKYQRRDPNRALDKHELKTYDADWSSTLPKRMTEKLYYNPDTAKAGSSGKFFDKDQFSAVTRLTLGLSSSFKECVLDYYSYDYPVYQITTFVRERDGEISKYYTEFHALLWNYGLNYEDIDFTEREMTPYDEYNIPSWFKNQNGADPDLVEAVYVSFPAWITDDDSPTNPAINKYQKYR